jgi:hypothetical protein
VKSVKKTETGNRWVTLSIHTDPNIDAREDIFGLVTEAGWRIRELASRAASLEDAFVDIVQRPSGAKIKEEADA